MSSDAGTDSMPPSTSHTIASSRTSFSDLATEARRHSAPAVANPQSGDECIDSCNSIIEQLSAHNTQLQNGQMSLDQALVLNKTAVKALTGIMSKPSFTSNTTCPLLAALAMEKLSNLLETCVLAAPGLVRSRNSSVASSSDDSRSDQSDLPTLMLGSFCVEQGMAIQIRAHVVKRELERALWALTRLAQAAGQAPASNGGPAPAYNGWAESIDGKLRRLIANLDTQ